MTEIPQATDNDPNSRVPARASAIAFEDESNYTACTMATGFAAQGTLQAPSYSKAKTVVTVRGTGKATDTKAAGTTITTLPAAHRPPVAIKVPTVVVAAIGGVQVAGLLSITTAGVVSVSVDMVVDDEVTLAAMFSTEATV